MNYNEALQVLFREYGQTETFIWMDCNSITKEEAIKEAMSICETKGT